jgi:hypothetical protein
MGSIMLGACILYFFPASYWSAGLGHVFTVQALALASHWQEDFVS